MNYLSHCSMVNITSRCPDRIQIGYIPELNSHERSEVLRIVNYWLDSTAIAGTDTSRFLTWNETSNILTVTADFSQGNFKGNLVHRDAIGNGDESFKIGLKKLLIYGHEPESEEGQTIPCPSCLPFFIQFVYDDKTKEYEFRAKYKAQLLELYANESEYLQLMMGTINSIADALFNRYNLINKEIMELLESDN